MSLEPYQGVLASAGFPTDTIVLDFESYFAADYNLRQKHMDIPQYVGDAKFEITGLGVMGLGENEGPWFHRADTVSNTLEELQDPHNYGPNLERCTVVGHNLYFDLLILREKYGITPKYTVDTRDLSRHMDARNHHSLEHLAKKYGAPTPKGDTNQFKGLHAADMSEYDWKALSGYCRNDIDITAFLLKKLLPMIKRPDVELRLAAQTLRMFLVPNIVVDTELGDRLVTEMSDQVGKAIEATHEYGILSIQSPRFLKRSSKPPVIRQIEAEDISKNALLINLFNQVLPEGETVPMKQGKKATIPTFSKMDDAFKWLLNHPVPAVRALAEARLAIKSWPNHVKRVQRILAQARCRDGMLGIPLNYYGGHLGRWSGSGKINAQNLGARDVHPLIKDVGKMLLAPHGYLMGTGDLKQIEARKVAWLSGQTDLVDAFAAGTDIYSEFAQEHIFHEETHNPTKEEWASSPELAEQLSIRRDFGKMTILACLAAGSPVLTDSGYKAIEAITKDDLLWDGVEYVSHGGVVCRGVKACVNLQGIWITPDHEILTDQGWCLAHSLSISSPASEVCTESLLSRRLYMARGAGLSPWNAAAPVVEQYLRTATALSPGAVHVVTSVLKLNLASLNQLLQRYPQHTGNDYATGFLRSLAGVKDTNINDMAEEVSECGLCGSRIEQLFLGIWSLSLDGMTEALKSTALITMRDTGREIFGLQHDQNKCTTHVEPEKMDTEQQACVLSAGDNSHVNKRDSPYVPSDALENHLTFDILEAGPQHRYQAGHVIVANCGFGMGGRTFHTRCRQDKSLRPLFDAGIYDLPFCIKLIKLYRNRYQKIVAFWGELERAYKFVTKYKDQTTTVSHNGHELVFLNQDDTTIIVLPSDRCIFYPMARVASDGDASYTSGKVKYYVYGGKLCVAWDTRVLTDHGVVGIEDVKSYYKIWDGEQWCSHRGVIYKGEQLVMGLNGVDMTPDHRILTTEGWRNGSQAIGLTWKEVRKPNGNRRSWVNRIKIYLAGKVHMREEVRDPWSRLDQEIQVGDTWLPFMFRYGYRQNTRTGEASRLRSVEKYEGPVHASIASGVQKLWGSWYKGLRAVGMFFRDFLEGHGPLVSAGTDARAYRQRRGLPSPKLPVGNTSGAGPKSPEVPSVQYKGLIRKNRSAKTNVILPTPPRASATHVYDIVDCGPNNRFTVIDGDGIPRLVHNCENVVQASARDVFGEGLLRLEDDGFTVLFSVHDQAITLISDDDQAEARLARMHELQVMIPEWATGLPVATEGRLCDRFEK